MKKAFVHRYKWSHHNRRRQFKKAKALGIVTLIQETKEGWLYSIPDDFNPGPTR